MTPSPQPSGLPPAGRWTVLLRFWMGLRRRTGLPRTVLVSLLAGMLLVVGVTGGTMLVFSNLAVQRQISRLPPELREQFRERGEGTLSGQPGAVVLPGKTDPTVPPTASQPPVLVGPQLPPSNPLPRPARSPANRARSFLRDVGESLRGASLVSALVGTLLAFLLARRIARPISAVSEAAVRVAAGDLSARAPLLPGDRETTDLARNFNVMAQGLQALEQERRDTVASIAHELRTPLTVMQARLDAIEDGIYPLDQEQVGHLSAQTQLLTRLVADLRTVSLAEAGRLTVHPISLRPLWLAEVVADDIQAARADSGVQVEVLGLEGVDHETRLHADPDRLRQVLFNLTENAFKNARSLVRLTVQPGLTAQPGLTVQPGHTAQPGLTGPLALTVQSAAETTGLFLHVDDDGPGIPASERERVFENFVRLDASRSRDSGGTGLGLAVVRALMLAHGGQVELGASPLGGTRATLRFPVTAAASSD
jgi:two-component system, OmpR family, sensor histidine kinase BaeS